MDFSHFEFRGFQVSKISEHPIIGFEFWLISVNLRFQFASD